MPNLHRESYRTLSLFINCKNLGFYWSPEFDFHHETEASKVVVDIKFDDLYKVSLHREPPENG